MRFLKHVCVLRLLDKQRKEHKREILKFFRLNKCVEDTRHIFIYHILRLEYEEYVMEIDRQIIQIWNRKTSIDIFHNVR
jgi:hypothetical protein